LKIKEEVKCMSLWKNTFNLFILQIIVFFLLLILISNVDKQVCLFIKVKKLKFKIFFLI